MDVFALYRWFHPLVRACSRTTSMSESKVFAIRNGKILWQPDTSAVKWELLPNIDPPNKSRSKRLVQMRRIARRFCGEVSDRPVADQHAMKKLRLLSQPIYGYSTDGTDGGLFAWEQSQDGDGKTPTGAESLHPETNGQLVGLHSVWLESRWSGRTLLS